MTVTDTYISDLSGLDGFRPQLIALDLDDGVKVNYGKFGDLLAEGAWRAAKKIGKGAEKYAMVVKGQELPMHEPRGKRALALAYSTSATGADHMEAPHDPFYESFDPHGTSSLSALSTK